MTVSSIFGELYVSKRAAMFQGEKVKLAWIEKQMSYRERLRKKTTQSIIIRIIRRKYSG